MWALSIVDAIRNSGQVRIIEEGPTGAPRRFSSDKRWCRPAETRVRPVAEEFSRFIASPRIQKLLLKYGFEQVSGFEGTANALQPWVRAVRPSLRRKSQRRVVLNQG